MRLHGWAMWTRSSARSEHSFGSFVVLAKRVTRVANCLDRSRRDVDRHPYRGRAPQASRAKVPGSRSLRRLTSKLDRPSGGGLSPAGRATRPSAEAICPEHAGALETSRALARGTDRDRTGRGRPRDRDPGLGCQAVQDSQRLDGTDPRTAPASTGRPHLRVAARWPDRRVPPTRGRRQRAMWTTPSRERRLRLAESGIRARRSSNESSPDPVTSSRSKTDT